MNGQHRQSHAQEHQAHIKRREYDGGQHILYFGYQIIPYQVHGIVCDNGVRPIAVIPFHLGMATKISIVAQIIQLIPQAFRRLPSDIYRKFAVVGSHARYHLIRDDDDIVPSIMAILGEGFHIVACKTQFPILPIDRYSILKAFCLIFQALLDVYGKLAVR